MLTGAGRGVLETPGVGFVGPSVEVLERLEMEGLVVVSCCRDCGFVGEAPVVGPVFLVGMLPVRSVVLELDARELLREVQGIDGHIQRGERRPAPSVESRRVNASCIQF